MNRFITADPKSCIGCHTCEVACAISHAEESGGVSLSLESATFSSSTNFHPRLTVIKNASVSVPVLCHQCDDAPCLNACPNNAIIYSKDSVQVVQERCIGCKSCVIACPYGVMEVVSVTLPATNNSFVSRTVSRALKCDLCINRKEGPACIASCPTDALRIVDHDLIEATIRQRQQQTALGTPTATL